MEQFESVAQLAGWIGNAKLVNLTTRLWDQHIPFIGLVQLRNVVTMVC